jgi:hypothetical protein
VFLGWDVPDIASPTQPSFIQRLLAKGNKGKNGPGAKNGKKGKHGKISIHRLKVQAVGELSVDEKPRIAHLEPRNWKKLLLAHVKVVVITHSHTVCDTLVKVTPLLSSLKTLRVVPSRIDSFRSHHSLCSHPSGVCPLAVPLAQLPRKLVMRNVRGESSRLAAAVARPNHRFDEVVWVLPPDNRGLGGPLIKDMIICSPKIKIVFFPDEETRYDQTVRNEVQAPSVPAKRLIQTLDRLVARKGMYLTVIGLEAVALSGPTQWMERIDWAKRVQDVIHRCAEERKSVVQFQTIEEYLREERADELGTGARKMLAARRGRWW